MQLNKPSEVNIDDFFENTIAALEKRLKDIVNHHEQQDKLEYFLNHGKRLRPLLSILIFRACGGDESNYPNALNLAAAIELQHSASLVHDDIIDGDMERRNKSTYYEVFGVEDAILTGHRAIVLGFEQVLRQDPKILKTFIDVWDMSLRGEIEDVASRRSPLIFDIERYFDIIINKTASLFAGAAKIGAQMAGANGDLQNLLWEYGKHIGIAYQLADDKLDLIRGCTEVLPVSLVAGSLDSKSLESLSYDIRAGLLPVTALSKLDVDVEGLFNKHIAKMRLKAENLATSSLIPKTVFRPLLAKAPAYMIERSQKS
jgi:geranylgeranyl pyrophosphate synthase